MMPRGVWVPAGCEVDHDKAMDARSLPPDDMSWLIGTPTNWGSEWGSQLSVFYALFHGWGQIVSDFLGKCKSPAKLRQWINEDAGETWEARKSKSTPERIGERLRTPVPRGVVPVWGRFLTVTIDQQAAEGGYRLYVVLAHGDDFRSHVVDYGAMNTLEDVWDRVVLRQYHHEDGGNPMAPIVVSADSGWDTKRTYDFCNSHPGMVPCKGSSNDLGGKPYKLAPVQTNDRSEQMLFLVNTDYWETDLQARLDERTPAQAEGLGLCLGSEGDIEFLEHLCNATISDSIDNRGNAKLLWVKKNEGAPNDFRDALRYGLALAVAYVEENGGFPPRMAIQTQRSVINGGETRPDGRPWI
jgi:phage terminase large subunit GpA-like protein